MARLQPAPCACPWARYTIAFAPIGIAGGVCLSPLWGITPPTIVVLVSSFLAIWGVQVMWGRPVPMEAIGSAIAAWIDRFRKDDK
ncbi:MAG: hypothetical protein ACKVU4_05185 [Phycisphaerales bacterium]